MSTTLAAFRAEVERLWPAAGAEEWDAIGLVCGNPQADISRVLLTVDVTSATVGEALESGADLVLAHHPLLLRGITSLAEDTYKGALLAQLIRGQCALLTAHTNADVVVDGVSDVLARRLGLGDVVPIVPSTDGHVGLGRVGNLPYEVSLHDFAGRVAAVLPQTAAGIRVAGAAEHMVQRIALCGGAGDSLLRDPLVRAADVYVTSDLRHHPASESREQALLSDGRPALIDVSHWASESLWLETAAQQLRELFPELVVDVSSRRSDPWDFFLPSTASAHSPAPFDRRRSSSESQ